jgi:ubiquinone/menaquinone biosynthesis C-methylase UbiE
MVTTTKSEKELAYLHELFISTDWGERFAELIDEQLELPTEGKALYVGAGTGGHALAVHERAGQKLKLLGLDENAESVELARAKAIAVNENVEFRHAVFEKLLTADNEFDLVIGNASLIAIKRVPDLISELIRTAKPHTTVGFVLPTASSFGEFFSIYWEALHNCGLISHEHDVEDLITQLPTVSEVEHLAEAAGLEEISSWTRAEEFDFDSGEAFLSAPLISDFLMSHWLESVPEHSRNQVAVEVARIINDERHEAEFVLTVKATLVMGRKARTN